MSIRILYDGHNNDLSAAIRARAAQPQHAERDLVLAYDPPPIPGWQSLAWSVTDWGTYDGAPDSANRGQVGYGRTAQEALAALLDMLDEEAAEDEALRAEQESNYLRGLGV